MWPLYRQGGNRLQSAALPQIAPETPVIIAQKWARIRKGFPRPG
jgi:hypothetical protein